MKAVISKPAAVPGNVNVAIASERLRIKEILDSKEAAKRPALAKKLALETALDAASALSLLREAPAEGNPYAEAVECFAPIGLHPAVNGTGLATSDPKARREAELTESMRAFNETKGYVVPKARNI